MPSIIMICGIPKCGTFCNWESGCPRLGHGERHIWAWDTPLWAGVQVEGVNRRKLLTVLGTGIATAATAGCLGQGDGGAPTDGTTTPGTSTPTTDNPTTRDPTTTKPTTTVPSSLSNGSFEDELAGWTVGKDMPEQVGPEGATATTTTDRAAHGDRSLALTLDGSHDDGTVWVAQQVDLTDVDQLTVDAWSPEPSFNEITQLAVYTGPDKELSEQEFDTSEQVWDHTGWKTYEYPVTHDGAGLVAVGISIVWETTAKRFLDNVRLVSN